MESRVTRRGLLGSVALATLGGCVGAGTTERSTATDGTVETETTSPSYDRTLDHAAPSGRALDPSSSTPPATVSRTTIAKNLEVPWDLSFTADGGLFLTERVGRVRRVEAGRLETVLAPDAVIDAESVTVGADHEGWFVEGGEGGVLGVAAYPGYPEPPLVYVYYTHRVDDVKRNRVVEIDAQADDPAATERIIVDGIPGDAVHNGGRLAFGPRNYLWITTGDGGDPSTARDPTTLGGSVLRVDPWGDPVEGNLVHDGRPTRIFSHGHRNPQGLAWLPDGTVLAAEHGPDGHDEINRLVAGSDYGWPTASRESEYATAAPDVRRPVINTGERGWAPSGCCLYTGNAVPGWRDRLLVGGLFSQRLFVVTLARPEDGLPVVDGGTRYRGWYDDALNAVVHAALDGAIGRIRTVAQGPDGALYVLTSNRDGRARDGFPVTGDDRLLRLSA